MDKSALLWIFILTVVQFGSPKSEKKLIQIHFTVPNLDKYPIEDELEIHFEFYEQCGSDQFTTKTISVTKNSDSVFKTVKIMETDEKSCIHIGFHLYEEAGRYVDDIIIYPDNLDHDQLVPIFIVDSRFLIMRTMIHTARETMCELLYSVKFNINEPKKCFGGKNTIYSYDYKFNPTNFSIDGLEYLATDRPFSHLLRLFPLFFLDYLSLRFDHIKGVPPINDIVSLYGYTRDFKLNRYSYSKNDIYHPSTIYLHKTLNYLQFKLTDCSKQLKDDDLTFCEVERIKNSYYFDEIVRVHDICMFGFHDIIQPNREIICRCKLFAYGIFCERSDSILYIKVENVYRTKCLHLINMQNYRTWLNLTQQSIFITLPFHEMQTNILLSFYLAERINKTEPNKPDLLHSKTLADVKNCSLNRGIIKCHFRIYPNVVVKHLPFDRIIILIILGILLTWLILTNRLASPSDHLRWKSRDSKNVSIFRDYSLPAPSEKKGKTAEDGETSVDSRLSIISDNLRDNYQSHYKINSSTFAPTTMTTLIDSSNSKITNASSNIEGAGIIYTDNRDLKQGKISPGSFDDERPKTKSYRITSFKNATDEERAGLLAPSNDFDEEISPARRSYIVTTNVSHMSSFAAKSDAQKDDEEGNPRNSALDQVGLTSARGRDTWGSDDQTEKDDNYGSKSFKLYEINPTRTSSESLKNIEHKPSGIYTINNKSETGAPDQTITNDFQNQAIGTKSSQGPHSKLVKSNAVDISDSLNVKSPFGDSKLDSNRNSERDNRVSVYDPRVEIEKLNNARKLSSLVREEPIEYYEHKSIYEKFTDHDSNDESPKSDITETGRPRITSGFYIINRSKSSLPAILLETKSENIPKGLPVHGIYKIAKHDALAMSKRDDTSNTASWGNKLHPNGSSKEDDKARKPSIVILTPIEPKMDLDEIVKSNKKLQSKLNSSISLDEPLKSRAYIVTPVKREPDEPLDVEVTDQSSADSGVAQRKYIITNFEPDSTVASQIERDKQEIHRKYHDIASPTQRSTTLIITAVPTTDDGDDGSDNHNDQKKSFLDRSISDIMAPKSRDSKPDVDAEKKSFLPQFKHIPKAYKDTITLPKGGKEIDEYELLVPSAEHTSKSQEMSEASDRKHSIYVINKRSSFESDVAKSLDFISSVDFDDVTVQGPLSMSDDSLGDALSTDSQPSVKVIGSYNISGRNEQRESVSYQTTNESDLESGSVIDHDFSSEFEFPGKHQRNQ